MAAKMTDDELVAIAAREAFQSLGFLSGRLSEERRLAMAYYNGEPYGDEIDGSSAVVTTEVRDTIEAMLPSFLKTFMGSEDVVEFEPETPSDEASAKQATDYCNYIFTKDNNGFHVLYSLFKDAFLSKLGVTKVYWSETERVREERYTGLYDPQFVALTEVDEVEVAEHSEYQGQIAQADPGTGQTQMMPATQHDVVLKRKSKVKRVKLQPVPPEQFMVSRRATTSEDAIMLGDWMLYTASELVAEGYDKDLVDSLPSAAETTFNEERIQRFIVDDDAPELGDDSQDGQARRIWVGDLYLKVDYDGDGIAELRRVRLAGMENGKLLENELADGQPYAYFSPIPMTHKFYGLSIADVTRDMQLIKSTVTRQLLDNMYRTNNARSAVSDKVNMDDLLNPVPGGVVRMLGGAAPEGQIMPLETAPIMQEAIGVLNYVDGILEARSGTYQNNVGFDPNSINKTATAANLSSNSSQLRQEMIARIAAETGVKSIFRKILELVCKHQDEPRTVRINKVWTMMDPRSWNDQMGLTINVGLGTNNKDQMLAHLAAIAAKQEQILMQLGPNNPLCTLENYYHTLAKMVENGGFRSPDPFFTDPSKSPTPPQPPSNPHAGAQVQAQTDLQKEQMRLQAEPQIEQLKGQIETDRAIRIAQINADATIEAARIKAGQDGSIAQMQASMDGMQTVLQHLFDASQNNQDRALQAQQAAQAQAQPQPAGS